MNQLVNVLKFLGIQYASTAAQAAVTAYLILHPTATDAEVVAAIDGNLKHQARAKVGCLVDFVWGEVSPILDPIIAADVATGRAELPVDAVAAAPAAEAVTAETPAAV